MREACHFDHVIANRDGDDSGNWQAFSHPIGDARRTMKAVAARINGQVPLEAETWESGLVP